MPEIPSKFNPSEIEDKWYAYWMEQQYFHSTPDDREPYTIVIPPPNVTGVLHMGHMLNNTIQDVLIRRARMQGKNACWVPGTDHASIATEAKVVNKLKAEGIEKNTLTRDAFLKYAWEWKEKHGGIILEQLKKLGASCDWERTRFTMDEDLHESVIDVFIDLYNKGLIYRGVRMVNWDPRAKTALSDEEVIFKELQSKLYYVRYKVVDTKDQWVTIATTRPETILGDTAVCVHPEDERYLHLHGKLVEVPLIKRQVPVIVDEYVDREFGTGALKITPAHDINDYHLGMKHKLQVIDIFNDDGTMSGDAGLFVGKDRFEVRQAMLPDLEASGNLVKVEDYTNKVGFSERTDIAIEPKLSLQWFLKMHDLAKPALDAVMQDEVMFHPAKFKNTYRHWMENVKDWCISRQLWWGQRIPVYYLPDGKMVAAKSPEEALEKARADFDSALTADQLKQDEDVVDTWFSSWLWPISVFDGIRKPDNPDIKYYYPTNDLVTAPEIIFFWVARMVMAGIEYKHEVPFKNVYFTGIVRDKLGRKMSKSLGNSPDPLELIKEYGADGVRVGMLLTSPAGNDLPFDPTLCEQGRNFSNKIWNALRLVKGWQIDESIEIQEYDRQAVQWFETKLQHSIDQIEDHFGKFRISDALMTIYKLIWDDFCSWYLEIIKPPFQQAISGIVYHQTISFFEDLMKLLHPFMPFISEEIWHQLKEREKGDDLIICHQPSAKTFHDDILQSFSFSKDVIVNIRNIRQEKNISIKEPLLLLTKTSQTSSNELMASLVSKICNLENILHVDEKPPSALMFVSGKQEFYIPMEGKINTDQEKKKLQEELDYTKGFLKTVNKKLSNERFMKNAPEAVVTREQQKKADAESRIKILEEQIRSL